jgi:hypothetical protein
MGKAGRRFRDDKKIEMERFSLTSFKPFDQVVTALDSSIGHPDIVEFGRSTHETRSFAELKSAVEKGLSRAGLMLLMQLDRGAAVWDQPPVGRQSANFRRRKWNRRSGLQLGNLRKRQFLREFTDSCTYEFIESAHRQFRAS